MDFELAHMQGTVIRALVNGKFRTRNPLYLFMMGIIAFIATFPLVFVLSALPESWIWSLILLIAYSPYWVGGIGLWVNVALSLRMGAVPGMDEDGRVFF